jgi:MATE family multidrug resistance protein
MTVDRRPLRSLVRVAGPLVLAQLAQVGMAFIDTVMVGRLGTGALAGIALGAILFQYVLIVSTGILSAVNPQVAQAQGRGDRDGVARAARQGLWLATGLALLGVALMQLAPPLLLRMGQEPQVVALGSAYLSAVAWGLWPALLFAALRGLLEGVGDTRPILMIILIGVGLNIVANEGLMFGRWGLPALGLMGTGVATALVYGVMVLLLVGYVAWRYRELEIFRGLRRPDPATLGELVRVGWPLGMRFGFEVGLFALASLLMGLFGEVVLAGHQVALQSASLAFTLPTGVAIATSVLVGQAVGRGDPVGAKRVGLLGIGLGGAITMVMGLLFWLAPRSVIGLFLDVSAPANAEAVAFAASFLAFAAAFQLFDGLQVCAAGALTGLKDTRAPMLIALVAYWLVGVPTALLFAFPLGLGGQGLWLGMVVGLAAAALPLLLRFAHKELTAIAPARAMG